MLVKSMVHKAIMAYPVLRGREADIVNYGIKTMDEGKTYPIPGSTPEPLGDNELVNRIDRPPTFEP